MLIAGVDVGGTNVEFGHMTFMLQLNPDLSFDVAALGDDSGVVGAASIGGANVFR